MSSQTRRKLNMRSGAATSARKPGKTGRMQNQWKRKPWKIRRAILQETTGAAKGKVYMASRSPQGFAWESHSFCLLYPAVVESSFSTVRERSMALYLLALYLYMHICTYMYVYVRICTYMFVYNAHCIYQRAHAKLQVWPLLSYFSLLRLDRRPSISMLQVLKHRQKSNSFFIGD